MALLIVLRRIMALLGTLPAGGERLVYRRTGVFLSGTDTAQLLFVALKGSIHGQPVFMLGQLL